MMEPKADPEWDEEEEKWASPGRFHGVVTERRPKVVPPALELLPTY